MNVLKSIITIGCLLLITHISAQTYNVSTGIRLGTEWGLTGQFRIGNKTTLEAILQSNFGTDEGIFTLLFEQHQPILFKRFNLYGGAGIHKGWNAPNTPNTQKAPFGLSLVGGVEATLARFNISYDIKPAFNLYGGKKKVYVQTGVSVRYVIVPRKTKLFNWKKKKRKKRKKKKGIHWKFWEKK